MPWITESTDFGYFIGPSTNLTGPTIPNNRTLLYIWKSVLKSAGWTVPLSWRAGSGGSFSDLHTTDINGWFILKRPGSDASFIVSGTSATPDSYKINYCVGGYQTGSIINSSVFPPTNNPVISGSANFILWNAFSNLKFKEECPIAPATNTVATLTTALLAAGTFSSSFAHVIAHNEPPYAFHVIVHPTGSQSGFNQGQNIKRCSFHFGYDAYASGSYEEQFEQEPYVLYYASNANTPLGALNYDYHAQTNLASSENPFAVVNNIDSFAREELRNKFSNLLTNCFWPRGNGNVPTVPPIVFNPISIAGTNRDLFNDSGKISLFPVFYSALSQNASANATANTSFGGQSFSMFGIGTIATGSSIIPNGTKLVLPDGRQFASFGSYAIPWNSSPISGGIAIQSAVIRNERAYTSGSSWFDGKMAIAKTKLFYTTGSAITGEENVYRGILSGNYVYSINSPPLGATNIVIISPVRK